MVVPGNHSEYSDLKLRNIRNYLPEKKTVLYAAGAVLLAFILISVLAVLYFKWVNPSSSSVMFQEKLHAMWNDNEEFEIAYRWTDWQNISPYVKVAAITSEDQRFPTHFGFDLVSIEKAIKESAEGERLRGASTITQQVAKNMFLWQGRTFLRKGLEAWFTLLLEIFWSKKRILEIYLNIAQFGPAIYGVDEASRYYFGIPPSDLNMTQSALLVTLLPAPSRYDIKNPSAYIIDRRNWILQYMFYLGNTRLLEQIE